MQPVSSRTMFIVLVFSIWSCSDSVPSSVNQGGDVSGLLLDDTGVEASLVREGCRSEGECLERHPDLSLCEGVECTESGTCVVFPKASCCLDSADCDPHGDDCLESFCPEPGGVCATKSICDECANHADCHELNPDCEIGFCSDSGSCEFHVLDICCADDADCDLIDVCVHGSCGAGRCVYGAADATECCTTEPVATAGKSGDMTFGSSSDNPAIYWQVIETGITPSPPYALYVGNSASMSMATIGDVNAYAIFELGQLLAGAQVDFRAHVFSDITNNGTQEFKIVLTGEGAQDQVLYDASFHERKGWHLTHSKVTLDVTGSYSVVLSYFQAGSIPGNQLGVLLDNVEIRNDCSPYFECFEDSECDDGDPCTLDTCKIGEGTASCVNTVSPPLPDVEEICGDGLDNDCNPATVCYALGTAGETAYLRPIASDATPNVFYNDAKTAGSGYTDADMINLLVVADSNGLHALHIIVDAQEDGTEGTLEIALEGAVGMEILLHDDAPGAGNDAWDFDPVSGEGNIAWTWSACCVDGMVLGYLSLEQCISFEILEAEGLNGIHLWQDDETSSSFPLDGFTICGAP